MSRTVDLGAPSLTGKDANDLVSQVFAKVKFPLKAMVTNHMPRDVVFPEVGMGAGGLFLRHCANEAGRQQVVDIENDDQLQRLASSVEQIAELNGYELALTIEEFDINPAPAPAPAPAKGKDGKP